MTATLHPARLWVAGAAVLLVLGVGIMAMTTSTQGRGGVLLQLERPAAAVIYPARTVGPGPVNVQVAAGAYRVDLRLAPNRASARDGVTIGLTRAGRQVHGATISLGYSMPSMGMPQVLSSTLHESGAGIYNSLDPVLAMPGTWRMRFVVTAPGARAFTVIIDDRMHR